MKYINEENSNENNESNNESVMIIVIENIMTISNMAYYQSQ